MKQRREEWGNTRLSINVFSFPLRCFINHRWIIDFLKDIEKNNEENEKAQQRPYSYVLFFLSLLFYQQFIYLASSRGQIEQKLTFQIGLSLQSSGYVCLVGTAVSYVFAIFYGKLSDFLIRRDCLTKVNVRRLLYTVGESEFRGCGLGRCGGALIARRADVVHWEVCWPRQLEGVLASLIVRYAGIIDWKVTSFIGFLNGAISVYAFIRKKKKLFSCVCCRMHVCACGEREI